MLSNLPVLCIITSRPFSSSRASRYVNDGRQLRYKEDVAAALSDVDAVIWCASTFNSFRQRLPDRVDEAASDLAQRGMNFFELRLGKAFFGEEPKEGDEPRKAEARGKLVDVDGLELTTGVLASTRRRREVLAELTGGQAGRGASRSAMPSLVLLSSAPSLGYDEEQFGGGERRENEFGFRKRSGEEMLRASSVPHVIVRSARIDDLRLEEGLEVQTVEDSDVRAALRLGEEQQKAKAAEGGASGGGQAATDDDGSDEAIGVADKEARKRCIHPRDVAKFLVGCLEPLGGAAAASADGAPSRTVDVWTTIE
jgi:hypothetical protein